MLSSIVNQAVAKRELNHLEEARKKHNEAAALLESIRQKQSEGVVAADTLDFLAGCRLEQCRTIKDSCSETPGRKQPTLQWRSHGAIWPSVSQRYLRTEKIKRAAQLELSCSYNLNLAKAQEAIAP